MSSHWKKKNNFTISRMIYPRKHMKLDLEIFKVDNKFVLKTWLILLVSLIPLKRLYFCIHQIFSSYHNINLSFCRFKGWQFRDPEYWSLCKHIIYEVNHYMYLCHVRTNKWSWSEPSFQTLYKDLSSSLWILY